MIKKLISNDWIFVKEVPGPSSSGIEKIRAEIDLPHDYAISQPRSADAPGGWRTGYFNGGVGKYSKFINFGKRQHTILDIDGAYMCAEIRLNKNLLAIHPHGYTPFLVDLTDTIIWESLNKIEITTNDMQPSTRWYSGAGIYRDVFLWTGGEVRIEPWDLFVVTNNANEKSANITVKSQIASDIDTNAEIEIVITDSDKNAAVTFTDVICVKANQKISKDIDFEIQNPKLWNLENPSLYTIDVNITVNGETVDTFTQSFGIREIKFTAKDGFTLNGKTVKLKGGCIHHDHGALGACAYPAAEERKIKKLKQAGFNSIRASHNPPSTALMEVCDREGILIMDEAFDIWQDCKGANDYHLWFADWWARDISYMVLRDRSHPSVRSYSIGNEISESKGRSNGAKWAKKLSSEIKKYDTSRPVTSALWSSVDTWENIEKNSPKQYKKAFYYNTDGVKTGYSVECEDDAAKWSELTQEYMSALDIVGYNYLYRKYDNDCALYPDRIIWGSETHAINIWHSWNAVMRHNNVLGDYTWTAYDNLGETGAGRIEWSDKEEQIPLVLNKYPWRSCWQGDFDLAGFRRPQSYFREMVWKDNTEPKIFTRHPKNNDKVMNGTGWHWYDVNDCWTFAEKYIGEKVKAEVYTKADCVKFVLNGKEVGTAAPIDGIARIDIPYEPGELKAETIKGGNVINASYLKTTGKASKIVLNPEKNEITADGRDLCYIEVYVTDIDGNRVPFAQNELTCKVEGGEFLCIFSGDPKNEDRYTSDTCHAFNGTAVAVVKAKQKGNIIVTVESEGLSKDVVTVKTR